MYVGVRTAGATTQMAVYKQFKQKVSSNKKQIVLPWKNSTSSFSLPASRERCEPGASIGVLNITPEFQAEIVKVGSDGFHR